MEPTESPLLEAALEYARDGGHVIPLHTPTDTGCSCGGSGTCKVGKHPRTNHWPQVATTDEPQIRVWWDQDPDPNLGLVTGSKSRHVVLDVDGPEGEAALALLEAQHGPLPVTREVRTGDGRHLHFALSEGTTARTKTLELGGEFGLELKLEFKGDGAYVVMPPSLHENGQRYAWANDRDIAQCPAWLVELVNGSAPSSAPASTPLPTPTLTPSPVGSGRIPQGKRNTTLTRIAGILRSLGYDEAEIRDELRATNEVRCNPPLPVSEVDGIAASIAKNPPYPTKGYGLPNLGNAQAAQELQELQSLHAVMIAAYDNPHLKPDADLAVRLARLIESRYQAGRHRNGWVKLSRAEIADVSKYGKEIYSKSKIQAGRDRLKAKGLFDVRTIRPNGGKVWADRDTGKGKLVPHQECWYLRDRPLLEKLQQLAGYRKPKSPKKTSASSPSKPSRKQRGGGKGKGGVSSSPLSPKGSNATGKST